MNNKKLLIPPPVYFIVSLIAVIIIGMYNLSFKLITFPYNLFGILIFILGFIFGGMAAMLFRKNKTTLNPNRVSDRLVIQGPFKLSRNPMYLGMFLMLLGVSIFMGNLLSVLTPIIFLFIFNIMVIPFEEKVMQDRFGDQFSNYKSRVRRWI